MKRHPGLYLLLVVAGVLLVGAALAGCAPDKSAPTLVPQDTPTPAATLAVPSADATPDDVQPNDDSMIADAEFTDLVCLDCHSNQELLQDLAVEEEPTESLSEGPG